MRRLIDTNVALDWLLRREPWLSRQRRFWQAVDAQRVFGYMPASAVTDVFYIVRRLVGTELALAAVRDCIAAFRIIRVDRGKLMRALALPGSDFEDNLQAICAQDVSLDAIITRDPTGFVGLTTPVLTPEQAIARFGM